MTKSSSLWLLHGFLGLPADWNFLQPGFVNTEKQAVNLWEWCREGLDLENWARQFSEAAAASSPGPRILCGYSMGGRLALHAALLHPQVWDGIVVCSAHPGLQQESERCERLKSDEEWARRFTNDSWSCLMKDWNNQKVLGRSPVNYHESFYERECLARALRFWSLGHQRNLCPLLRQAEIPCLWVVGEKDDKYLHIAKTLEVERPGFRVQIVKNSGHRILREAPEELARLLGTFCQQVTV